jgi:hypothetical protein
MLLTNGKYACFHNYPLLGLKEEFQVPRAELNLPPSRLLHEELVFSCSAFNPAGMALIRHIIPS